ncbi:MAG: Chromosome partition protein Smc [Alphaproteobacteria bacterium MarineAlpha5_Bin8]|nr:MAG: Chromosome partition protein Smc [Alphaproteobacteria bacterium MarineAlpha5_Bin7]PPR48131.1 MAG: Chromosome partition protein Smc [Alphaproteobacteria bacterium MarineAlpha5_Bin8]|tara:strand:- start:7028 stop:9661 length:2634 start_codon:yes stop_codon:yes gene_type:complete
MIKFNKLKLKGFKSFVEPTEVVIEQGLTGIVGPNGCGKSNLVEAFRFVMGELSPKQMRGSELDDVIFNGTSDRPAWDIAEVTIDLDNKDRKAPGLFNQSDEIEVTRRIWRGEGSEYRVNGKEVRLKDVQLLFADAATGARSTSMVSQGRVGAIIAAKPEQRRTLLEEAAGITGLHSRRHDAELRLNSTENNLARVKDVLKTQEEQLIVLKKQSKQAERYKNIQNDITRARASVFYQRSRIEKEKLSEANDKLKIQSNLVSDQTEIVSSINVKYEQLLQALPDLRLQENKIASELQKHSINLENQEKEIERANTAVEEIQIRIEQINDDVKREEFLLLDTKENLSKVRDEKSTLQKEQGDLFNEKNEDSINSQNQKKENSPIIDYLDFEDGYEKALAAVFSDELMASIKEQGSSFWKTLNTKSYQSTFPEDVIPFSKFIKAPDNLKKRLDFIGLIKNKDKIDEYHNNLLDGQVLVSESGEIWRWDGFTSKGKENASIKAILEQLKNRRLKQLTAEEKKWLNIMTTAKARIDELKNRESNLKKELDKMKSMPISISSEKVRLLKLIEDNKKEHEIIAKKLQDEETKANETNKELKLEEVKLNEFREEKIRVEGIIGTHNESIRQLTEQVKERLNVALENLYDLAKINPNKILAPLEDLERKLERLIAEQERLGGVNLLAEQEAKELEDKVDSIKKNQSDLIAAISKLREAIDRLNTEGRQRLLAAYGIVNENFQKLFFQLFGGGKAYLKFTDESDPLEAGLDIFASPPGKKLQNLSLLSGGEQALTALSLLFAVFLSNPAPICVLDEVDAPLDDTNVDRFCSLVEEMSKTLSTKFLIITHHRMTMARVNRLFGVTMPEQGVSQLVSVDLEKAVQLKENE